MSFLKIIAAFIGYSIAGFGGAIVGWLAVLIGGILITDGPRGLMQGARQQLQQERQAMFIETLFLLMGKLAKADGQVSKSEIQHIEQFMAQMGMTAEHRKVGIGFFKQGVDNSDLDIASTINRYQQVGGKSLKMKHLLLTYLIGVALADGELHHAEHALLNDVAAQLGYSQAAFNQLITMIQGQNRFGGQQGSAGQSSTRARNTAANSLSDAYQALGVNAQSSDKEVKRAYRKLISQYHPDKLIGQGVPEDMIQKATERSKEIHLAYDLIVDYRKNNQ